MSHEPGEPDEDSSITGAIGANLLGPDGKVDLDALRAVCQSPDANDDDSRRRLSFTLARDLRKRLDAYIAGRIPFLSRSQVQRIIGAGAVTLNDKPCKPSAILKLGDVVTVVIPPVAPNKIEPEPISLTILFEDEHLIVLNKQAGVIVHPARSHRSGTLINGLAWHFANASEQGGSLSTVGADDARPGVVHRLDRDTTGVIVFAKDDETHWRLGRLFEKRRVDKRYLAVTHGAVVPKADVIDLPLGPHPNRAKGYREKQVVRHDHLGKQSITIYRTIESFQDFTVLEIELRTGRTHQIRAHLSHLGFPVAGDEVYGGRAVRQSDLDPLHKGEDEIVIDRQALHAASLSFEHPHTQERLTFTAPTPDDMQRLIDGLKEQE